jgi:hypothetical protein
MVLSIWSALHQHTMLAGAALPLDVDAKNLLTFYEI